MQPLPSTLAPFVSKLGRLVEPFVSYLQQFTIAPSNVVAVTVGISPYSYEAKEPGNLFITSGTISDIRLTRGAINLDFTGQKLVPVAINDTVTITYTVLPTINFIPSYGQNTNG